MTQLRQEVGVRLADRVYDSGKLKTPSKWWTCWAKKKFMVRRSAGRLCMHMRLTVWFAEPCPVRTPAPCISLPAIPFSTINCIIRTQHLHTAICPTNKHFVQV